MKFEIEIKAILSGVDESVINNLDIGNNYAITKDSLTNSTLYSSFDYTVLGVRRIYEDSKINDNLNVALLSKTFDIEISSNNCEDPINKLHNIEEQEINYVDNKMRLVRLYSENGFNIKEMLFNCYIINGCERNSYLTSKIPFPDKIHSEIKKLHIENKNEINMFICSFNTDNLNYSKNLLDKALFLYDQSYYAPVLTLRFMTCIIGLETLLVDGNNELSYKLSRNCSMLLSNNIDEYKEISAKVKKMYDKRSKYVHNADVKNLSFQDELDARDILRRTIRKVCLSNTEKSKLLKQLDLKGYIN